MKRLVGRVLLVAVMTSGAGSALIESPDAAADSVAATAVVLNVVDGDTIDIRDDLRGRLRVRVLGIDSPETKKPGYTVGCWGPEATEFARSEMLGQRVALVLDPTQDRTDRYGRTLAYLVRADNWDYSVEATRAGAARSYVFGGVPVSRAPAITAAEQEARDAKRGLWGPPCNGDTSSSPATVTSGSQATVPSPSLAAPPPSPPPPPASTTSVYYKNCDAARAVGAAPIRVGQPGYRTGLDRDGDGTACDS
nr:thermonuclease family protein [Mycolicibacterium malmesburyense]CRL78824.1 micrococcal nuclease-like nuclease [Mycolicibacterium malmesburyense]